MVLALGEGPVQQSRRNLKCTLVQVATIARCVGNLQESGSAGSAAIHSLEGSGSHIPELAMQQEDSQAFP